MHFREMLGGKGNSEDKQMAQAMQMAAQNPMIEIENAKEFMELWAGSHIEYIPSNVVYQFLSSL